MYFRLHWLGIEAHAYTHYISLLCFASTPQITTDERIMVGAGVWARVRVAISGSVICDVQADPASGPLTERIL